MKLTNWYFSNSTLELYSKNKKYLTGTWTTEPMWDHTQALSACGYRDLKYEIYRRVRIYE